MSYTEYAVYLNELRLPVNPEEITIKYATDHSTYNVLDVGEVIIPREAGLRKISWEGFFPGDPDHPYVLTAGSFKNPRYYIDMIDGFREGKDRVRLIINRYADDGSSIFDTNIRVVVDTFEVTEKGGETGDFYYSITLSEYRAIEAEIVNIIRKTPEATTAVSTPQRETSGTEIAVGDSVVANGTYYYDSYGSSPTGTANNLQTTVSIIVGSPKSGQKYPYHIGHYGWLQKSQLRKVQGHGL